MSKYKIDWFAVDEIRDDYYKSIGIESKNKYCIRKGKKFKITDVEVRRILNNQRWKNPEYGGASPGRNDKLSIYDVREIRQAFINKPKNILVKDFVKHWSLSKKICKSQICNVIYNRAWYDEDYTPPKCKKKTST